MDLLKSFWIMSLVNVFMALPWTLIFLFVRWSGLRLYYLRNRELCRRIQKRLGTECTHTVDGKLGAGYAIGRWYLISMEISRGHFNDGDTYNVWLITTEKQFQDLTMSLEENEIFSPPPNSDSNSANIQNDENQQEVATTESPEDDYETTTIHERIGSFGDCYFRARNISLKSLQGMPHQKEIVRSILQHFRRVNHTVVFLHGPVGSGKSVITLLVAKELRGSYCSTLRPWQPGDSLGELHADIEPTREKPLIVVFDEIDAPLVQIHRVISPHNQIPIAVPDKPGWNRMLDEIQWGLFPNMILVMTSNKPPDFINNLDESYLRKGRVDLIFPVMNE